MVPVDFHLKIRSGAKKFYEFELNSDGNWTFKKMYDSAANVQEEQNGRLREDQLEKCYKTLMKNEFFGIKLNEIEQFASKGSRMKRIIVNSNGEKNNIHFYNLEGPQNLVEINNYLTELVDKLTSKIKKVK